MTVDQTERIVLGWCEGRKCGSAVYNTDRVNGAIVNDEIALCSKCAAKAKITVSGVVEFDDAYDEAEEFEDSALEDDYSEEARP